MVVAFMRHLAVWSCSCVASSWLVSMAQCDMRDYCNMWEINHWILWSCKELNKKRPTSLVGECALIFICCHRDLNHKFIQANPNPKMRNLLRNLHHISQNWPTKHILTFMKTYLFIIRKLNAAANMFASTKGATEVIAAVLQQTYSKTSKKTSQPLFFGYCFKTHSDFYENLPFLLSGNLMQPRTCLHQLKEPQK